MMTFGELFRHYYERHAVPRTKSPENAECFFRKHGIKWSTTPLDQIKRGDLQMWVDELGVSSGPQGANRAINQMAAVINWGVKRGYITMDNPCRGVERFRTRSRKRFLMPAELQAFKQALDQEQPMWRDFFWMCLFTGARKGNVLRMRWQQLDLSLCLWQIPADEFKNGEDHCLPLSAGAMAILQRREGVHPVWVFPGDGPRGHLVEAKRAWERIKRRSGLTDVTIHDLRRTVGSYMAINGVDLVTIKETLGHKDLRSTLVYARLNLAPVKLALEAVQERWLA